MNNYGQNLWSKAKKIIPGGNQLLSKRPERFLPEFWPTYYSKAKGCRVWDLEDNELESIPKEDIYGVVDKLYTDKEQDLKKYIRGTMRKNFPDYDKNFTMKTTTEEIILEMFEDPDFSKTRLAVEIENFQDGKKN